MSEPAALETVLGVVERVLYRSDDGAFAVLLIRADGISVKAAGPAGDAEEGQLWRFAGEREAHPKYGERLKIVTAYPMTPETAEGLRSYLAGGRFAGVGAKIADKLVAEHGARTFDVLASDLPMKIPGLGKKKLAEFRAQVRAERLRCETLSFLAGVGLGPVLASKVAQRFGDATVATVRTDPYRLSAEVRGIGFPTADALASSLGIRDDHPSRLRAGLAHSLKHAAEQGHVALPRSRLVAAAARLLAVEEETASSALGAARVEGLVIEDDAGGDAAFAYLPVLHAAETEAAGRFLKLRAHPALHDGREPLPLELPETLSEEQRDAVRLILRSPVSLLTGGPGVGKTTVLKAWVEAATALGKKILLAAPTGRAARRMEEATGRPASTLHRLLGLLPAELGGGPGPSQELDCDALAVDEASMLDLPLFLHVLRSLPERASLVLVGDPNQLPSVGPGDVLNGLLRAGVAPVARLTKIFRQDEGGLLIPNAHRVLEGRVPTMPEPGALTDFYFMERETPEEGAELVRELVVERLPKRFGFAPRDDIQTLCPMHRGAAGTEHLNALLQEALNGSEPCFRRGTAVFRRGDRVIAVRNDYVRFVANGETGRVLRADDETGTVEVAFGQTKHVYRAGETDDLAPAFALTVHKAQGSEYPAVILPLFTEHFPMLRRAVVYTAMTRARRLLVLVGQKRALKAALSEARRDERWSLLERRLSPGSSAVAAE